MPTTPTQGKIDGTVRQYAPRKALVRDIIVVLPRDAVADLEAWLADAAGAVMGNHTVYEINQSGHQGLVFIMFSDDSVLIGRTLDVQPFL